ncbi:pyridoxal-phosphate dependent enzyme [Aureimonas sp. AU40]|uniref:pyridoxal-phosphate dependent enzyme n=1 Tax=Aureimonas sp. AU40 TaxID=1637747 RepID=UPI000784E94B|nr:pyridoxal-phosphate dependent enzyme [Aureimonas sp. AU40]
MPLHIETPLIESSSLGRPGLSVWLKLEALQPPGSFKIRGIGHACERHAQVGKRRFVSSSGGNAGLAVAYAGRRLGLPVTVVVPETTSARARALIEAEGAELRVHGAAWHEANALALSLVDGETAFLHPFDDPLLWEGHASLIDEALRQGPGFDAVVLSVGGGGLLSGVVEGLRRNKLETCPIFAVETEGAASLTRSVEAGRRVTLEAISTVATSLAAREVCEQAFALTQSHDIRPVLVDDRAALGACERFLDDHRILVEPACGAALAAVSDGAADLSAFRSVLVVVCGGAVATIDTIRAASAALGERD